jgi:hypothetical protein
MPIPGYRAFQMGTALFSDLFPDRANEIDGDDKDMVRIDQALQEACLYGEGAGDEEVRLFPTPGGQINVIDRRDGESLGSLEMDKEYNLDFVRLDGISISLTQDDSLDRIFTAIFKCRQEQDKEHGGPEHDDTHTPSDWCEFIEKFRNRAEFPKSPEEYEASLIHVASLAIAAIESSRRKRNVG